MSSVARRFSRAAQTYERGASLHRHVAARLAEWMPDPDDLAAASLLEAGCGTGVLSERLLQRYPGASLCLLDVAGSMVEQVRERWGDTPRLRFVVSDIRDFQSDRPFDWVFSSSALHWATPLELTFGRIRDLLAPGGGLSCALMLEGTLGELHALRRRIAPGKMPAGRLPTSPEVLAALGSAGLTVSSHEEESIQTRYHSADDFLQTLHAQGLTGGGVSRAETPLSRTEIVRLRQEYDTAFRDGGGGVRATIEVLYFRAIRC